jgi:hypothetical protein
VLVLWKKAVRYTDGRAWINACPVQVCEEPTIETHVEGLILRLDTKAVSLKDALILNKYREIVINVWKGPTQLWATPWFWDQGQPLKGHLYIQHVHGRKKFKELNE